MNPLFNANSNYNSNYSNMMQRFDQFKKTFSGNPRDQIQQLLNSGRISQSQYDAAVQKANELFKMMNT